MGTTTKPAAKSSMPASAHSRSSSSSGSSSNDDRYLYMGVILCKLLFPSLVTYLATRTPLTSVVSVWIPLVVGTLPSIRSSARATNYTKWLRYWSMHASLEFLIRFAGHFISFFLMQHFKSFLKQAQLLAYLVLCFKTITEPEFPTTTRATNSILWDLWEQHVLPRILICEATISVLSSEALEASSKDSSCETKKKNASKQAQTSNASTIRSVLRKLQAWCKRGISVLVVLGMEKQLDFVNSKLKILTANPKLMLPALSLLVPVFGVTKMGLLYLQWILPAAQSILCSTTTSSKTNELYWMKYWMVQGILVHGILDYMTYQLPYWLEVAVMWNSWMLLMWITLLHEPYVVESAYTYFEMELVGFGLLQPETTSKATPVTTADASKTKTVQFIKAVLKKLPSAHDMDAKNNDGEGSDAPPPQWLIDSSSSSGSSSMDQEMSNAEISSFVKSDSAVSSMDSNVTIQEMKKSSKNVLRQRKSKKASAGSISQ